MSLKDDRKKRISAMKTVIGNQFPISPEANLMKAVLFSGIDIATSSSTENKHPGVKKALDWDKNSAIRFLSGYMEPAELCGVRSDWIRKIINKSDIGLSL